MGVGYFLLPIVIVIFYIIPIGLFFFKRIRKVVRIGLLFIPILITVLFVLIAVIDSKNTTDLYNRFPQMNKITFNSPIKDIKDSIIQLQLIMDKLPKRWDHKSVSYSLDKYPGSYNNFSFNWFKLADFHDLVKDNNFHDYQISESNMSEWKKYVGLDFTPFDTLSYNDTKRLIGLIQFLDFNKLNAANLADRIISFDYYDSLRISNGLGFRKIVIDTSGYFGSKFFDIKDHKEGLYLLIKK
jgi:hypothetical protein